MSVPFDPQSDLAIGARHAEARVLMHAGEVVLGEQAYTDAIAMYRNAGRFDLASAAMLDLAKDLAFHCDERALDWLDRAMWLAVEAGLDIRGGAYELASAEVLRGCQRYEEAVPHYRLAMEQYQTAGAPVEVAAVVSLYAFCVDHIGPRERIVQLHEQAVRAMDALARSAERAGSRTDAEKRAYERSAMHLEQIARAELRVGNHRAAHQAYSESRWRYARIGTDLDIAGIDVELGRICVSLGRSAEARWHWTNALRVYGRRGLDARTERVTELLDGLGTTGREPGPGFGR